jgi:hypothetical protein
MTLLFYFSAKSYQKRIPIHNQEILLDGKVDNLV